MDATSKKVALITGANAGIGYALADKLLGHYKSSLTLCMACRNRQKAEGARQKLLAKYHGCSIDVIEMDTSDMESVKKAAILVNEKYPHIDYLYLNAGILAVSGVDWTQFWKGIFSTNCIHMLATGDGLLKQVDGNTKDGLKQFFATNLLGHFMFMCDIEEVLGGAERTSQIIWTSSSNALKRDFNIHDIQHTHGSSPYGSSKYATDLVSVGINNRLNSQGIYSHVTCPGLVMTNITYGIMPGWFWTIFFPLLYLLRICIPSMTITPENGCESLIGGHITCLHLFLETIRWKKYDLIQSMESNAA